MGFTDPNLERRIRECLAAGDNEGAATAAIRGYGPQVLGYLTAVLRDETRADEAFSAFSEDLWKGLPNFRGASAFSTWAYKVAWSAASRVAREQQRRRQVALPSSSLFEVVQSVRADTALHLRSEVKSAIQKLRDQLTPAEQTLLILRVDRDLGWDEIASVFAIDAAAARKRFERVKAKLGRLAKSSGIGEA